VFVVSGLLFVGSNDPIFANISLFALPGVIVYPACWYMVIFRQRDYALSRTMALVFATFGAVSVVVAALFIIVGSYMIITNPYAWVLFWYGLVGVQIGAIILIVPYILVATPMALLHRWLLLKLFAPLGSARVRVQDQASP
jgi:hypothetical protein